MNLRTAQRHGARWVLALLLLGGVTLFALAATVIFPQPFYPYHHRLGRLSLYADRPFAVQDAEALLRDVEARLDRSPLNDSRPHAIFVAASPWRRLVPFAGATGAAAVNHAPLTNNVFLRRADIAAGKLYRANGQAAPPPRTLAYYAAHEITHSLTAEYLGPQHLWNRRLPQWVREGYADYVGLNSTVDIDALWRRQQAGDPQMTFAKSRNYDQFALLAAYFLRKQGWSVETLLASGLSLEAAEAAMARGLSGSAAP